MKNILQQRPNDEQYGRTKYILSYVKDIDVKKRYKIWDVDLDGLNIIWFREGVNIFGELN